MPKPIHRIEYAIVRQLLADLRHSAQLKQEQVANALGQPQPYISAIETGHRRIDIVELRDLCNSLGVSLPVFVRKLERALADPKAIKATPRRRVDR